MTPEEADAHWKKVDETLAVLRDPNSKEHKELMDFVMRSDVEFIVKYYL